MIPVDHKVSCQLTQWFLENRSFNIQQIKYYIMATKLNVRFEKVMKDIRFWTPSMDLSLICVSDLLNSILPCWFFSSLTKWYLKIDILNHIKIHRMNGGLDLMCLMPLSTIFQLYWCREPEFLENNKVNNMMYKCSIKCTLPWAEFEHTTLVVRPKLKYCLTDSPKSLRLKKNLQPDPWFFFFFFFWDFPFPELFRVRFWHWIRIR